MFIGWVESRAGTVRGMSRLRGLSWLGVDVVCVLVFCAVGRRSHDEGLSLGGVATTAWPFLIGTILGWVLSQGWRRPTAVAPTGVVVWVCTVAVGMLLRRVSSAGVAASFVVVASLVTALLLLGWRAVASPGMRLLSRRW
jgi:peptidoglycan/LPS O-acetylase OafA/YrhL